MDNTYSNTADVQIWRDFKAGSKAAYSYIYTRYASILYNYGYKIVQDSVLVEDCIQDLFVHLLTHRTNLSDTDSIKYYLFKALRREIIGKINSRQKQALVHQAPFEVDFQIVFSYESELIEQQSSAERRETLLRELNNLPARQKEAIFLRFYDNLSYEQIASIMGIDQTSVYKTIYKAIDALQRKMVYELIVCWMLAAIEQSIRDI